MSDGSLNAIVAGEYQSKRDKILGRLAKLRKTHPHLYEAFKLMADDIDHVVIQLNPISDVATRAAAAQEAPPTPSYFAYSLSGTSINFTWLPAVRPGSTMFYELRKGEIDWDSSDFVLRTASLGAAVDPQTVGTHVYRLKALNSLGDESPAEITVNVVIPALGTPSVSAQVIDNNVLLSWTAPTSSFNISHYEIYKDSVKQGETSGTFFSLFESVAGTYTYGVVAVDIAGNSSPEGQYGATVDEPPDFQLVASVNYTLSACTLANMYLEANDGAIYGPVDLTETIEQHFNVDQTWASPQAQVDDGYSLFIQENEGPGTITTTEHDLGSTLNNVIVNVDYTHETLATTNAPTIAVEIRGSTTPGGGSFVSGASQFFTSVRYITVRITVTGAGSPSDDSMTKISGIVAAVDVKYAVDGNVRSCLASDSGGTQVNIPGDASSGHGTKTFTDVDSITLAPLETNNEAITAIYDFTDAPNPTNFKILCFDNAGRRVDATVSWKIRGIEA